MSWLFSRALAVEYSLATCSGGVRYAPLNVMPTVHRFSRNGKMMDACRLSRFGLTCEVLTESHGAALLTWYLEDSRARIHQLPGMAPVLMASAPACGEKWQESSVRYDLDSSSWKIHPYSSQEGLPWSSVILPKWGMMLNGSVYQHPTAERPTCAIEYGWSGETFPTPSVAMHKGSSEKALTRVNGLSRLRNRLDYWVERDGKSGRLNPEFVEWVMGWPIGWTDLKPLEMGKFREWQRQHSIRFPSEILSLS